jgi:tetratricopeptide (TPR) repeat protein
MGSRIAARIAVLLLIAAPTLQAADFEVVQLNNFLLELRGGSGANAWHIQYGTDFRPARYRALSGPGPIAYFSHYNVLRRIDLDKGVVTGRWIFPGYAIRFLTWKGSHLEVVVSSDERRGRLRTVDFDPDNPQIPVASQAHAEAARAEALRSYKELRRPIKPADAANIATELENTIRRDPFSPWLRVGLGHLYGVLKNSESARWIDQGIQVKSAHFSELLDISNFLAESRRFEPSRVAFERGYAEFWRTGQDPRLVSALLVSNNQPRTPEAIQRELAERAYALNPWVDGAAEAWERYGNYFIDMGDAQTGALWLERSKEARNNSLLPTFFSEDEYTRLSFSLVATCALAGVVLYALLLYLRYRPQRQARLAAARAAGVSRPGFFNVEYWRTREKLAFLSLVVIAWISTGYVTASIGANDYNRPSFWLFYAMTTPGMMDFTALEDAADIAASPERDLLLAIAYQRDARLEDAERLYRSVPQFAEGWNNLGVILKNSGKNQESQAAFERALALKPDFPEAEWNLGKPARGNWVTAHAKYAPDKAMMAVPTRSQMMSAVGIQMAEPTLRWTSILAGPLSSGAEAPSDRSRGRLQAGILVVAAAVALIMFFIRPREVLKAPPNYQTLRELLFPGTSRAWGVLGGIVLGLACYFSSALWPPAWTRSYLFYNYSSSNLSQFPIPFELRPAGRAEVFSPTPSFWWLVALLAVNAAVVLLWKWRRK